MADSAAAIDIINTAYAWPNISSKLSELNKIKNVMANNITSIEISIKMMFFLFKTNPNTPIKKSKIDKFMIDDMGFIKVLTNWVEIVFYIILKNLDNLI